MVDNENPKNWTKQYVSSHLGECLLFLRELNVEALNYIERRRYYTVSIVIETILNGLDALLKSGTIDGVRLCIASYSCVAAELCALADPVAFEKEIRDMGGRPDYQGKSPDRYLRDLKMRRILRQAEKYRTTLHQWCVF